MPGWLTTGGVYITAASGYAENPADITRWLPGAGHVLIISLQIVIGRSSWSLCSWPGVRTSTGNALSPPVCLGPFCSSPGVWTFWYLLG